MEKHYGFASGKLKADKGFMLEAVKQYGGALKYASDELRADREFMLKVKAVLYLKIQGLKTNLSELKTDEIKSILEKIRVEISELKPYQKERAKKLRELEEYFIDMYERKKIQEQRVKRVTSKMKIVQAQQGEIDKLREAMQGNGEISEDGKMPEVRRIKRPSRRIPTQGED